jgi:hypothetical protein
MTATSTLGRVEPQRSAEGFVEKIATITVDMEGAVAAVLKMYQVTLDDKNIDELGILLTWGHTCDERVLLERGD